MENFEILVPSNNKGLLKGVARGRSTGVYDLNGRNLTEVPRAIYDFNEELGEELGGNWWDAVEPTKLLLARNSLTKIDEVDTLTSLIQLDVSHNKLKSIPESLANLQLLKVLSISDNCLTKVPESVLLLPSLVKLDVSSNELSSLPATLGRGQPLNEILLNNNCFNSIPESLGECPHLVVLNVSHNKLSVIPDAILQGASNLQTLDASHNQISGPLPAAVGKLQRLAVLNLNYNQLASLPPSISNCTSLVELHVANNGLRTVPEDMGSMRSLRVLELRNNYISDFPQAACSLKLSLLDLTNNELTQLPSELGLMTELRALRLEGNALRSIRQNIIIGPISVLLEHLRSKLAVNGDLDNGILPLSIPKSRTPREALQPLPSTPQAAAAHLPPTTQAARGGASRKIAVVAESRTPLPTEIVMRHAKLKQAPDEVHQALPCLVKLDLSSNLISDITPEMLTEATALMVLQLPDNRLTEWPLPIRKNLLERLTQMSLARNPIATLPLHAFDACSASLRVLDLSGVPAVTQPGSLAALARINKLQELSLVRSGLSSFPPELLHVTSLRHLNVSGNPMEELPSDISQLKNLNFLDASNNNLRGLPPTLGLLAGSLSTLLLEGNPLRTIRRPLLTGSTLNLLEYLKTRIPT